MVLTKTGKGQVLSSINLFITFIVIQNMGVLGTDLL